MSEPGLLRMRVHEAGHAVVGVRVGFEPKQSGVFVGARSVRPGGVDFEEKIEDRFASSVPLEKRIEFGTKLIAIYAAGYLAERRWMPPEEVTWSESDCNQIRRIAVAAISDDDDAELLDKDHSRGNGWSKWGQVDALVQQGEECASELLTIHRKAVLLIASLLKTSERIPGSRLKELIVNCI